MKDEIENAVKALVKNAQDATAAHEAMQWSQAALNAAHAFATLRGAEQLK